MPTSADATLARVVAQDQAALLDEWMRLQLAASTRRADLVSEAELRDQSQQFLQAFHAALSSGAGDLRSAAWEDLRRVVAEVTRVRSRQGFSPSETATFALSLKQPIFSRLRAAAADADELADAVWRATELLDTAALHATEVHRRERDEVIQRQQQELLELSTPVVKLWDGILALPLIGTLDSARTQVVMENLLQQIVDERASLAIVDITGVPTVDTLVAQHLLKTIAAARLMGADCIISGIRPQIAQTIVHLGVELGEVTTKASLADAFAMALRRRELAVRPMHG